MQALIVMRDWLNGSALREAARGSASLVVTDNADQSCAVVLTKGDILFRVQNVSEIMLNGL
jgi:hypothetical protein